MPAIQALVGKFGAVCGRPQRERVRPGFNYSLFLHGVTFGGLEQMRAHLSSLAPQAAPAPAAAVAAPAAPVVPETVPASKSPAVERRVAPPEAPPAPAVDKTPAAEPDVEIPKGVQIVTPSSTAPKAARPPEPVKSPAVPVPAPAPAAAPVAAGESMLWGAVVPLDPNNVFETLSVGPFNRFAHAASMAVVSNPGTMYNPLFLYGAPGSGKTHLLMAISKSIQDASPGETVLVTTGPRLSRAVRQAVSAGKIEELHARVKKSKALMIDDIHLMAINDKTQKPLVAIFDHCFKSSKHVGMTSAYAARALGGLEEALKFQISSGWSVELKHPTTEAQLGIVQKGLARAGAVPEPGEEKTFLDGVTGGFAEYARWLRRLHAVLDLRKRTQQPQALSEVLPVLFAPMGEGGEGLSAEQAKALSDLAGEPRDGGASSRKLAVFYPGGTEEQAKYMVAQFRSIAERNGFPLALRQTVMEPYDPNQLYGVPFSLADVADRGGAEAVLLLGAPPGSGLGSREGEFIHAVEHILGDWPLAWIPYARIQDTVAYFRAALDLQPVWTRKA
ncbi:MAG: ATP-binding protein [Elusimicrobia bacterium]|nr:ATP-binding protein [Elusimicrobiota bacterium]